jgi:hypothetical protein
MVVAFDFRFPDRDAIGIGRLAADLSGAPALPVQG